LGSGNVETYTGSETRIVRTVLEDLGSPLSGDTPQEVLRQVKGQKVPINLSYTLSADGNYMQRECDYIHMFYRSQSKRFDHYEIAPGYIKWTLRRVSGPVKVEARGDRTAAVAQVESRGEFYVLTKDGRKLAGKDANQIPLEEGTKVITGNSGHVRMKLPDDTTFTIGPNSDIVIDSFVYDTDNTPKKVVANMTKGVFRWVTGKTKALQDTEMKVKLPIMAVGIRGTDFEASVKPDNSGSVVLHFGQLEITENKTGFRFIMDAGYKVTFNADGSVSRPMKVE